MNAQIVKLQREMRERITEVEEKIRKLNQSNEPFGEQSNELPAAEVTHPEEIITGNEDHGQLERDEDVTQ